MAWDPVMKAEVCDNPDCQAALHVDHVTLVTTRHVRRFCSVECIIEGHRAVLDRIYAESA